MNTLGLSTALNNINYCPHSVFTELQWQTLEHIIQTIIDEPNALQAVNQETTVNTTSGLHYHIHVYPFVKYVDNQVQRMPNPYTDAVMHCIEYSSLVDTINQQWQTKLQLLRLQLNVMYPRDYISTHTDQEQSHAYQYSILIRTQCAFSGGELVIIDDNSKSHPIMQPPRSILVVPSTYPHYVNPIKSGSRHTLCGFLG